MKRSFLFLSCLLILCLNMYGQETWTSLNNPWYASDPRDISIANDGTMFTIGGANRELVKSTDQGSTWTHMGQTNVYCVAVKPDSSPLILIGLENGKLMRTTNGGTDWPEISLGNIAAGRPNKIAFNITNPMIVLVGTVEGTQGNCHLYRSTSAGQAFSAVPKFYSTSPQYTTTITDIVFNPANSDTVYLSGSGVTDQGTWRSTDAGNNWTQYNSGLYTGEKNIASITIDPSNRKTLYCCTYDSTLVIYKSTANTPNWIAARFTATDLTVKGRAIRAYSSSVILVATTKGIWHNIVGSSDWEAMSTTGLQDKYCQSLAIKSSTVYCGTAVSFYKSADEGVNWTEKVFGMVKSNVVSAVKTNDTIYTISNNGAIPAALIHRTTNGGTDWNVMVSNKDSIGGNILEGTDIAMNPTNHSILLASCKVTGNAGPRVLRSSDNGTLWIYRILTPSGNGTVNQIAFNTANGNNVYLAGNNNSETQTGRVWVSSNAGVTFTSNSVVAGEVKAIIIDPNSSSTLYCGTSAGVYKSTNSGVAWTSIGLASYIVNAVTMKTNGSRLYAGTNANGVFYTSDNGSNWTAAGVTPSASSSVNSFYMHPKNSSTFFISGTDNSLPFINRYANGVSGTESDGLPSNAKCNSVKLESGNGYILVAVTDSGLYKKTYSWSDSIDCDLTWQSTKDIHISGARFIIPINKSLTIDRGTNVEFVPDFTGSKTVFNVYGTLYAGDSTGTITNFSASSSHLWQMIHVIDSGAIGYFKYCNFSGYVSDSTTFALFVESNNPTRIENCTFNKSQAYAYWYTTPTSPAAIAKKNRVIGDHGMYGVRLYYTGENFIMDSCYITGNRAGIYIVDGHATFRADTVENNGNPAWGGGAFLYWVNFGVGILNSTGVNFGGFPNSTDRGNNVIRNNDSLEVWVSGSNVLFGTTTGGNQQGGCNQIYDTTGGRRIRAYNSTVLAQYTNWGTYPPQASWFYNDRSTVDYTNSYTTNPPNLLSPNNGGTYCAGGAPNFRWNKISDYANYELEVSLYSNFSSLLADISTSDTTYSSYATINTTYYWRVRGSTSCTSTDWSNTRSYSNGGSQCKISLDNPDNSENIPKSYQLSQNFPNPFNPVTQIKFDLPLDVYVTLKVFNVLGQEVVTLVDGYQSAGYKSVEFDASQLPSGIYFYRIQADKFTENKKMIILK